MFFRKAKSPLEDAIVHADCDGVRSCLAQGGDPDARLPSGKTPLFAAIDAGSPDVVRLLLAAKANPELRNRKNHTALYMAAREGREELVRVLLAAGANPNAPCGPQGQTPLFAVMEGFDERRFTDASILRTIAELLLDHGADCECRLTTGVRPIHGVAICDDLDLLELFLAKRPDINAMAGGAPPIAISVRQGRAAMVSRFVEAGATTDVRFPDGLTLLDMAQRRGDQHVIRALGGVVTR
jgi:ankyrin repeat protein